MPKVNRSKDCGNSPKNKFAESIAIAIELGDSFFLKNILTQDALWELADGVPVKSEDVGNYLPLSTEKPVRLTIDHVVTHGKAGAVNGTVEVKGGPVKRFCHVIGFSSAKCDKVRRLLSYGTSSE